MPVSNEGAPLSESGDRLRRDAIAIWRAGVAAVDSARLVRDRVRLLDGCLEVAGHRFALVPASRVVVVGAGKAGAGMAAGLEDALAGTSAAERLTGWINVPADCVRDLPHVHLHAARPAGVNEPTGDGVVGSREILRLVGGLSPADVCVVLLSGGGSALLPAPVTGITLADKQAVTRFLMAAGATISELNCVRKQLSEIKGGNLARAAHGARLISLIISDVIGDPLDVIASGPTVPDSATAADALAVLSKFASDREQVPQAVWSVLEAKSRGLGEAPLPNNVVNIVIGNNDKAVGAAGEKAVALGYAVQWLDGKRQGIARDVGRGLAELARLSRDAQSLPIVRKLCILSGGEPVVPLVATDQPRKGGRNQELVLGAVAALWEDGMQDIAILSGGTDGEDGPTDAAGAWIDTEVLARAAAVGIDPRALLERNDAYHFFEPLGALLKTGPTDTNVCDVRVVLVER